MVDCRRKPNRPRQTTTAAPSAAPAREMTIDYRTIGLIVLLVVNGIIPTTRENPFVNLATKIAPDCDLFAPNAVARRGIANRRRTANNKKRQRRRRRKTINFGPQ